MVAERGERWGAMKHWGACSSVRKSVEWRQWILEEAKGQQCYGGFGRTEDFAALVLLFPHVLASKLLALPFFWAPTGVCAEQDEPIYKDWIKQGFMVEIGGNMNEWRCYPDYTRVRADIQALSKQYGIQELAIDRAFQGDQMAIQLFNEGGIKVVPFGQGFLSMAAPARRLGELVLAGNIEHGNNPILQYAADEVNVITDAVGNMKPCMYRMDYKNEFLSWGGITETVMALGRATANGF